MEWGTITSTIIMAQGFVLVPCAIASALMTLDVWRRTRRS